jgi:hypothetical protein
MAMSNRHSDAQGRDASSFVLIPSTPRRGRFKRRAFLDGDFFPMFDVPFLPAHGRKRG